MTEQAIPVSDVVFRDDLYPRIKTDPVTVQRYAESIDVLPPIEVNQHYELIDGWHRWTAHKKAETKEIRTVMTKTASDADLLELSIERNAKHGMQLSAADKRAMASRIYLSTAIDQRQAKKQQLASILSVNDRTVREWLSDIDKNEREARNRRIFEMWLACHTQEEIATAVGMTKQAANLVCQEMATLPKLDKRDRLRAEFQDDWDPPIYSVWTASKKSSDLGHFGNSEQRWVENLLYLYTDPFDVVVDLFAGSGTTIDLCRQRLRRYYVSDRKPIVERECDIRLHDITNGLPRMPWEKVRLVYLDPPYWKQAEGKYSKDPEDLANMDEDAFHKTLHGLVRGLASKMTAGFIALIMQPTQWNAPNREQVDHVAEMIRRVSRPIDMRIQAPYSTQQCTPQMVEWAKENRRVLMLSREIVVWRVA